MSRDDILRMAREANLFEGSDDQVVRFATLIAAAERKECAKVCDDVGRRHYGSVAEICAKEIRARGQE